MVNSIDASDHLKAVIRPTSELHLAVLVIEREPRDVWRNCHQPRLTSVLLLFTNLTGRFEDAGWDVGTDPSTSHYYISLVSPIKSFAGAEKSLYQIYQSKTSGLSYQSVVN